MQSLAIQTVNLTKTFKSKLPRSRFWLSTRSNKSRREIVAVDHVNLEIRKGEFFGLLGPNGAGKTTFIKMLCTLLTPDEGTASINGFDIRREQMGVRKSVGTLFSIGERGFFWRLDVFKNLEFYASVYNVPRSERPKRIRFAMEVVGLQEASSRRFQELSGGMKRKLGLARALLANAPILLLDEPTLHLDVSSSRAIRNLLRNRLCQEQGKTIVYTTHHVEETDQICDRIAIIHKGGIVICNSPHAIKRMIRKEEAIEIKVQSITQTQLSNLRGLDCVHDLKSTTEEPSDLQRIELNLDNVESLSTLFSFLADEKIKLIDLKRKEPSLEDAFIELTEGKLK